MAATIRPSLVLNMDIDERQYSDDVVAEIKRSYSYVAPSVIAEKPINTDAPIENVIRLAVRMHRPYWDTNDAAACEQWDAIMPKWLTNMFSKVSATVKAANGVRAKADDDPLPYAWMEVEFGKDITVAQATNSDSSFPEDALSVVEQVRNLMGAGALGEDVVRVSVPAHALWAAQRAEAVAAAAEADVQAKQDESAGAAEEGAAEVAGETAVGGVGDGASETEQFEGAEGVEGVEVVESAETAETAESAEGAEEAASGLLPFAPAFEVDRSLWGIEYVDGTTRLFDAETGAFTE